MPTYIVRTRANTEREYAVEASDREHARDIIERGDEDTILLDITEGEEDIVFIHSPA